MITFYLIGNWMGSFRTESSTETIDEFIKYINKYKFILGEDKIYRTSIGNGRIVITSISNEDREKLDNPKIDI